MKESDKKHLFDGMFKGATLNNVQVIGVVESGAKVVYREGQPNKHEHFPPVMDEHNGLQLLNFLMREGFVSRHTDEASFLYLMGCTLECPSSLHMISWEKNVQLLREMLELAFKPMLDDGSLRKADIERMAPLCFERQGEPAKLAKPKTLISYDSDRLKTFLRPLCDPKNI